MNTTKIALFSACIGAGAGILSQYIANALRDKTDRKKIILDLIAEERKLAHMILLNQKGYSQTGFTIEYYYQLAVIQQNTKDGNLSLQRHHEEIKFSNGLHAEYCTLIGDYCKNIYKLILYVGHSIELEGVLLKIINHVHVDINGIFDKYKTYPELYEAYSEEQKLISIKIEAYKSDFNQMHKTIQSIKKY